MTDLAKFEISHNVKKPDPKFPFVQGSSKEPKEYLFILG